MMPPFSLYALYIMTLYQSATGSRQNLLRQILPLKLNSLWIVWIWGKVQLAIQTDTFYTLNTSQSLYYLAFTQVKKLNQYFFLHSVRVHIYQLWWDVKKKPCHIARETFKQTICAAETTSTTCSALRDCKEYVGSRSLHFNCSLIHIGL